MTIFIYKDWPEMRKSKVSPSEFTAFTVSEILRENQQDGDGGGGGVKLPPPHPD